MILWTVLERRGPPHSSFNTSQIILKSSAALELTAIAFETFFTLIRHSIPITVTMGRNENSIKKTHISFTF